MGIPIPNLRYLPFAAKDLSLNIDKVQLEVRNRKLPRTSLLNPSSVQTTFTNLAVAYLPAHLHCCRSARCNRLRSPTKDPTRFRFQSTFQLPVLFIVLQRPFVAARPSTASRASSFRIQLELIFDIITAPDPDPGAALYNELILQLTAEIFAAALLLFTLSIDPFHNTRARVARTPTNALLDREWPLVGYCEEDAPGPR